MNIITSIIPKKDDVQAKCIKSWFKCGFNVYSINCKTEWEVIKKYYNGVVLIEPKNTSRELYKTKIPYPSILDILEFVFNQKGSTWITNSDIYLELKDGYKRNIAICSESDLIFGNRFDVISLDNRKEGIFYGSGYDWFVVHKNFEHLFKNIKNHFCIGQPFWDYWIPLTYIRKGMSPTLCMTKIAYHQKHSLKWDDESFYHYCSMLGSDFRFNFSDKEDLNKLTSMFLSTIIKNSRICQLNENLI